MSPIREISRPAIKSHRYRSRLLFCKEACRRLLLFVVIWIILTGADPASWIIGLPSAILAVSLSFFLAQAPWPVMSFSGAVVFLPYFIFQSFHGGIDVIRRALSRPMPIDPGFIEYQTWLPAGAPRIVFVNTISLLPGTLSADLQDGRVVIHTIDHNMPVWANIQNLEWRVAALFDAVTSSPGEQGSATPLPSAGSREGPG